LGFLSTELAAWLVGSRVQWAGRPYGNRLPAGLEETFKGGLGDELRSIVARRFEALSEKLHAFCGTRCSGRTRWRHIQ